MTERTPKLSKQEPQGKTASAGPAVLESLDILAKVLDEMSRARRPLGVTEVSLLIGHPKARVYRHLSSMRQLGLLEQEPISEKYRLGARLVGYGNAANSQFDLKVLADPYLTRLRDHTGQTAVLSVAAEGSAIVVTTVDSKGAVCVSVKPGTRLPGHSSAQGRIVLAWSGTAMQTNVLKRKLEPATSRSMSDPKEVQKRLLKIRERLFDDAEGEGAEGINALAAPIFSDGDQLAGVVAIVGTTFNIPSPPRKELVRAVQSAAAEISARLNGSIYSRIKL